MQMIAFSIEGYRRFVERTSVKLHGKMIAFVGPNEAGKSSLLKAMARVNAPGPFDRTEFPRRSTVEPRLAWILQLDEEDRAEIADIHDASQIEGLQLVRHGSGRDSWDFRPANPKRPNSHRVATLELLKLHRDADELAAADTDEAQQFNLVEYDQVVGILERNDDNFNKEDVAAILSLAGNLQLISSRKMGESDAEHGSLSEALFTEDLSSLVKRLGDEEGLDSPFTQCWRKLNGRLPTVRIFGIDDRNLQSSYDLAQDADDPPTALANLAMLADLDLGSLRDEATAPLFADLATRRDAANQRLRTVFAESWNQGEVAVQIEVQGTILHILATTPSDGGLSDIEERSDGMRWFAALVAFCHALSDQPVILVDEIETHLHYDAQADLVDVLSAQDFAAKVIYTTHSFGCLPLDLGTGVRVVEPIDTGTSKLENGFWHSGAGFQPLLASMGAAALSFTPTRQAVIAEGPADAILLPTLFRQALEVSRLSFQVAPGLSIVAAAKMSELETEAGSVAYLVDGDQGGRDLIENLKKVGIPEDRIVILHAGAEELELEDLIDPDVYVSAVNAELKLWNATGASQLTSGDLTSNLRSKGLRDWCASNSCIEPDKRAVAQRVADEAGEKAIFDASRQEVLRAAGGQLIDIFNRRN